MRDKKEMKAKIAELEQFMTTKEFESLSALQKLLVMNQMTCSEMYVNILDKRLSKCEGDTSITEAFASGLLMRLFNPPFGSFAAPGALNPPPQETKTE